MSVKTNIAAIAAFIAVAAAPEFATAQAAFNAEYNVVQIAQRPVAQHRALRNIPADAYGYVGAAQTIRPSQLTGGQGHDFQLEGRF
jgi:hypothetical protein